MKKRTQSATYPPDERDETHCSAKALHSLLEAAIILIVVNVAVPHEPDHVLYERDEDEQNEHAEHGPPRVFGVRQHENANCTNRDRDLVLAMDLSQHG